MFSGGVRHGRGSGGGSGAAPSCHPRGWPAGDGTLCAGATGWPWMDASMSRSDGLAILRSKQRYAGSDRDQLQVHHSRMRHPAVMERVR
jgi:hypothetical protein